MPKVRRGNGRVDRKRSQERGGGFTFEEVFGDVTAEERIALVWRLAAIRSQRLIEMLLPPEATGSP